MKHKMAYISALFLVAILLNSFSAHAQPANPQQTLTQYISDLQKSPNDCALREKIIKHVQTMSPAPTVPEEAKRYIARGKAAFKDAKEMKDFNESAKEFKRALLAAPWLTEGYYNLGIVQDKAGLYADAMQSLRFYLMAAPNAPDTEKVKELIYEIEYRQEKAAKESSPQAIAEKKQNEYEAWLKNLNGARYVRRVTTDRDGGYFWVDIYGDTATYGFFISWSKFFPEDVGKSQRRGVATIVNRAFEGLRTDGSRFRGRISDDGKTLFLEDRTWGDRMEENIYNRER